MTIQAKFPGTCSQCGARFAAGTSIEWARGQAPRHTSCQSTPAVRPAYRGVGFPANWSRGDRPTCFDCLDGSCNRH